MRVGGVRRVEVPGTIPMLGYPLDRSMRFTNETIFQGSDRVYKCVVCLLSGLLVIVCFTEGCVGWQVGSAGGKS